MRLQKFRVANYRSVNDSGWIDVAERTALVGRNESGKSNLLLALRALKPPHALERLSIANDFPRGSERSEFSEDLDVIRTVWELSDEEREALAEIFPRARQVQSVEVARGYAPERRVSFGELEPLQAPIDEAKGLFVRLLGSRDRSPSGEPTEGADEPRSIEWDRALEALGEAAGRASIDPNEWSSGVKDAVSELEQYLPAHAFERREQFREVLSEMSQLADQIGNDSQSEAGARDWIIQHLPTFIYLDDYPEIEGHQDLEAYLDRRRENRPSPGDAYFEKLMTVAGLDVQQIHSLLGADHETRRQLVNRAGAAVTRKLRKLWKDRALKVRFNLDGQHFDTLVSDPNSVYDVEVNLNERSRGMRWFFSFYVTFAAESMTGASENTVLLLDEPGLSLHAMGQKDLLELFVSDFDNQVLFTTHSPFMIPTDDLGSVRTVTISEDEGTVIHNTPTGDERTLFPILHAFGVELSRSLFLGKWSMVVEEVTDFWYLSAASHFLKEHGRSTLPRGLQIMPSGSCSKVPYMVSLLNSHRLNILVLLSEEPGGRSIGDELVKTELIHRGSVTFLSEAFAQTPPAGADVEDLLDPGIYDGLVRDSYAKQLRGKTLQMNDGIPRIVKRYEDAFARLAIPFSRMRPARLFLRRMAENPGKTMPIGSRENFERLFRAVGKQLQAIKRESTDPVD